MNAGDRNCVRRTQNPSGGAKIVLRSKTPDLVRQEFYGLLMAHFAIRGLMHEAALKADEDPDRLSFLHAVRVVRRNCKPSRYSPCEEEAFHKAFWTRSFRNASYRAATTAIPVESSAR